MIFVTGGTGLVGSHLLLSLVQQNDKVIALKRKSSKLNIVRKVFNWNTKNPEALFQKIKWVDGDILEIHSIEPLLAGVNTIYHCAATVSFDPRKRRETINNNVEGTANIVNAAISQGVKRICHVSSVSALGHSAAGFQVTEETNWIPSRRNTGYSESKFFSEAEIWRGVEEGLEGVVINPSIIVGPGNWESGSSGFFGAIYKGLKFYPSGSTGFVDVRDVVDAINLLMDNKNFETAKDNRFLLNGENLSYKDFFNLVADNLKKTRPSIRATGLMLEFAWRAAFVWSLITRKSPQITRESLTSSRKHTAFDASKITKMFDFHYRTIKDAVAHTASCFVENHR